MAEKRMDRNSVSDISKTIRITSVLNDLIKAKALENHTTDSEIIKQAIAEYINKNLSDNEIFHASLNEIKHQLYVLDNKIKKYPAMWYQAVREIFSVLPLNQVHSKSEIDYIMEQFSKNVSDLTKKNREGVFETIIIDEFEKTGIEDK